MADIDDLEYWLERAMEREHESYLRGAGLSLKLFEEYQRAARRIRAKVREFYSRYARENGLSFEDAARVLNQPEFQEWKKTLEEYMEEIKAAADPQVAARLKSELDALSYNSQITRLQVLEGQINLELNSLYDRGVVQMKAEFGDLFEQAFYKKMFDIQQRVGFMTEFAGISTKTIENIVSYPWSGAHFSDRLWRHKQKLIFSVRETLTQGTIQGTGIGQMSKKLAETMGQSYRNAERLVMTETAHFHNEATFRAYSAAGVEEYEFRARPSEKTCDICGALDAKHFPITERQEGRNAPVMHPRCHCVTVEYDPEEALDWLNSGVPMPHRMTYKEWKARHDSGKAAEKAGTDQKEGGRALPPAK